MYLKILEREHKASKRKAIIELELNLIQKSILKSKSFFKRSIKLKSFSQTDQEKGEQISKTKNKNVKRHTEIKKYNALKKYIPMI